MIKEVTKRFGLLNSNIDFKEIFYKANTNLFFRLFGLSLGYLLTFLLIKLYGTENFGKWALATTVFFIVELLSNIGISSSAVRFFAEGEIKESSINLSHVYKKSLSILLVTSFLSWLFLYFLSSQIAAIYSNVSLIKPLAILSFGILPLNLLDLNLAVFKGLRKVKQFSFIESIGKPLLTIIFILIAYQFSTSFVYVFKAYVLSLYILLGISCIWVYLTFKRLPSNTKQEDVTYSDVLKLSWPMFVTGSMSTIDKWLDIFMVGFFCNNTQIGGYSLAVKISKIISLPFQSVNTISVAKFRQFFIQNDIHKLKDIAQRSTKLIFIISLIPATIIIVFSNQIIKVFDEGFLFAITSMVILSISQLVNAITGSVGQILNMTGAHKTLMWISIASILTNVILNLSFIPYWGINGAAIATFGSILVYNLLANFAVKKRFGFYGFYLPFKTR